MRLTTHLRLIINLRELMASALKGSMQNAGQLSSLPNSKLVLVTVMVVIADRLL